MWLLKPHRRSADFSAIKLLIEEKARDRLAEEVLHIRLAELGLSSKSKTE